jgi:tripeptidyl-peptidase-1
MKYIASILFLLFNAVSSSLPIIFDVEFSVALKQNNTELIKQTLLDISNPLSSQYGKYWSLEKISKYTETEPKYKNTVINWFIDNGIPRSDMNVYSDSIYCRTNKTDDVQRMFNVTFIPYTLQNKTYLVASGDYRIPEELNEAIDFVEGISRKRIPHTIKKYKSLSESVDPGYMAREVIERLYNIKDDVIVDNNESVGAVEYQGNSGFSQDNLIQSQKYNGEKMKKLSKQHIIGIDGYPDTESELDIQMISQTSEDVDIWYWGSKNWLYTFSINFLNAEKIPDVISMSWGWAEDQQCTISNCTNITSQKYLDRVNTEYAKIGLRGTTIVVSSGDAGAPGRTSERCDVERPINPVYPGSSPWVTSLGATFVVASNNTWNYTTPICSSGGCATGTQEIGTNYNYTGWTAGGGFSIYSSENLPEWQKNAVDEYMKSGVKLPTNFSKNGRAYPDISVVGHNCPVNQGGLFEDVDGTSCSAPIFASIVSILNQHQRKNGRPKLGYLNPVLYKMYSDDPTIFNDIQEGGNWCSEYTCCPVREDGGSDFGFKSTKGYDPVTGLGTPDVTKMMKWLDKSII